MWAKEGAEAKPAIGLDSSEVRVRNGHPLGIAAGGLALHEMCHFATLLTEPDHPGAPPAARRSRRRRLRALHWAVRTALGRLLSMKAMSS